jgi:hypothetical protein
MPPCESTLGYIDLATSNSYEQHSSQSPQRGVVVCIIDLTGSGSKGRSTLPWRRRSRGWGGEDLEDHRVVEESIKSARHEEEEVHRAVEDSFESLREDRIRAWLRAKNIGMKASSSLQIPANRFDNVIHEVWMSATARRKAAWEAWAAASMSGCNNHFTSEGAVLDNADTSSSSALGSGGGDHVLDNADASSSSGGSGPVIDVSSGDEGEV